MLPNSPRKRGVSDSLNPEISANSDDEKPSTSRKRPRHDNTQASTSKTSLAPDQRERVQKLITRELAREIQAKEAELELIDERLEEAHHLLERLRYAIVAEYYKKQEQQLQPNIGTLDQMIGDSKPKQIPLHPSLKKIIGKKPHSLEDLMRACPKRTAAKNAKSVLNTKSAAERREERLLQKKIREEGIVIDHSKPEIKQEPKALETAAKQLVAVKTEFSSNRLDDSDAHALNTARLRNKLKCHFVVGNTSKFIGDDNSWNSNSNNGTYSHKWLVYVQTKDTEVPIEKYIKKVRFFLHPSYRPNDIVDINAAPFQIARRGWGEFPMRIQLFFHEKFLQKPVQLIHKIVLDTTKSGRHTLGAETVVEVWLRNEPMTNIKEEKFSENGTTQNITTTLTNSTNTTATLTPTNCSTTTSYVDKKPRTISFTSIKEAFDDNFFDFLNKIEESRTSICADIEKIEPTVLVNESLEAQFAGTNRSPIKKDIPRSPLKRTPPQPNAPNQINITPNLNNDIPATTFPSKLPKAIKDAATKIQVAINQTEPITNGEQSTQTTKILKTISLPTATTTTNSSLNEAKTIYANASPITHTTQSLSITANTNLSISGKVFNNMSGTIILPMKKQQIPLQHQKTQNPLNATQVNISNGLFQKKFVQIIDAQGKVKTVQILVAPPKTITTNITISKPTTSIVTTPAIRTANINLMNSHQTITTTTDTTLPPTSVTATTSSKSANVISKIASANNSSPVKTHTTANSKNVVFQKEGKLYIIDPLQMKLKQQQKNQVSLLKPQLKQQNKQSQPPPQKSASLQLITSDHDYAPPPSQPSQHQSLVSKFREISTVVPSPQLHFGMRETRINTIKVQDLQRLRRFQFERKFNELHFTSMRAAAEYLLRRLPLVVTDKESPAATLPFVRSTPQEFQSLPAFKQRSCEWLRAKFIGRLMRNLKSLQHLDNSNVESFWSTREIATFARFYAYTPPIKALQSYKANKTNVATVPGTKEHFTALIKSEMKNENLQLEYDSVSPAICIKQWIESVQQQLQKHENALDDNEVVVVDDDSEDELKANAKQTITQSEVSVTNRIYGSPLKFQTNSNNQISYMPPPTRIENAFQFVGDICKDHSIRLRPEEIVPGVVYPTTQTLLAHLLELFLERLLRQSIGNQMQQQQELHNSNNNLPHNTMDRLITSQDIRKAIMDCAEFDFLTNRNMGMSVPSETVKQEFTDE